MSFGYAGRILHVNLSSRRIWTEEPGENFYRTYLGGRGLISHYLYKEVPANIDPLGPDNLLIFAGGPLSGQTIPGAARISVGAKSPLTLGYGDSEGGGHFGPQLAWAGYDALIIRGQSLKPAYLWINDEKVEIRDAEHLWGLNVFETQETVRRETETPKASAAIIGPAGERLVKFACIALGTHNYVGRAGLGAVMGAKRLKAVVVSGSKRSPIIDPEAIKTVVKWLGENYKVLAALYHNPGTSGWVMPLNDAGGLPTRNFTSGGFEAAQAISGQNMAKTIGVDVWGCFACPIKCKRIVEVPDQGLEVTRKYGGPEYESIGSVGSNCGVADLKVIAKAHEICNQTGIDVISAGSMISGIMEAAEKGLVPPALTAGLDLRFGSTPGLLTLLLQIAARQGLGDILAEGPRGATDQLGPEIGQYFLHVKGQPVPLHEPRWKRAMGIGFALSSTGADHMHNIHDSAYAVEQAPTFAAAKAMGILQPLAPSDLSPAKVRMWVYLHLFRSLNNCLPLCLFCPYSLEHMTVMVKAATGWNITSWELIKISERVLNLTRAFNAREGFSSADDVLPERFFEPLKGGTLTGQALDRQEWFTARNLAYDILGWDQASAWPQRHKLLELGLDWVAEMRPN